MAVLSLADVPVVATTPVSEVRRLYMRLASLIHPDKIGKAFAAATEAFQILVQAFDAFANGQVKSTTKPKPEPVRKAAEAPPAAEAKVRKSREEPVAVATSVAVPRAIKERKPRARCTDRVCYQTPLACPNCQTPWVPDTPKLYTLVMAYGLKVHCETCLLQYGWATAHHFCPLCKRQVDYDPENYDGGVSCGHCAKPYGYHNVSIDDRTLEELNAKVAEDASLEQARQERELRRMSKRSGVDDMDMKVGQCIVDDRCPVCRKMVKKGHRAHVESCVAPPVPAQKEQKARKALAKAAPAGKKKPRAKTSTPKPKSTKPKPKSRAKKAADSDSDATSGWGSDDSSD